MSLSLVPSNVQEALSDPNWKEAIGEEINALYKNEMFDIVDPLKEKNPMICKWVFTINYNVDCLIER